MDEGTLRRLVFQTYGRARRTQDSPIMPDVWLRYIRVAESIAGARLAGEPNRPADVVDDIFLDHELHDVTPVWR